MNNFIFDKLKNKTVNNACSVDYIDNFQNTCTFRLDEECVKYLMLNHRQSYKTIAKRYNVNEPIFDIEKYKNDYIRLDKAYANNYGVILTNNNETFLNGGCLCGNTNYSFGENVQYLDQVISITGMWADGIWHFPFEALVALMAVPEDILKNSKIHVAKISNFITQWFDILNIPSSKLVTGDVFAEKLYVPRMGKCGNPYYEQVLWLQNNIKKNIPEAKKEYIILIKRNNRRKLKNHDTLQSLLQSFCDNRNLSLYIHDDDNLPTLIEQQRIFSKAKAVFAPHGAGGINIIAMKTSSWYIEFLSTEDINICYSRLAYLCNVNYIGLSMSNFSINLNKIIKVLIDLNTKLCIE